MKNGIRYLYTRDDKWAPNGCLAIKVDRVNNLAQFGLSVRHPADAVDAKGKSVKFDRRYARNEAVNRLENNPQEVAIPNDASQTEITQFILATLYSTKQAPSRARRFAKRWLQVYQMLQTL